MKREKQAAAAGATKPDVATRQPVGEPERRVQTLKPITLRSADDGGNILDGYGAVFNEETVIGGGMWGFRERIAPGAFADSIIADDVRGLFNHDANFVLGRNVSGTMRLKEDGIGLHYEIDLNPDDNQAVRVAAMIKRGDVSGSSFAFSVADEGDAWDFTEVKNGKLPLRTITRAQLYDVSPVTYPAYPQTTVSARAQQMATPKKDESKVEEKAAEKPIEGRAVSDTAKTLMDVAHRDLMTAHNSVRSALTALDITGVPDDGTEPLTDTGGASLDTGRAARDAAGNSAMYYAASAMHHASRAAIHSAAHLRAMCRDASDDGDGGAAGDGANAADLDMQLRERELELERLR